MAELTFAIKNIQNGLNDEIHQLVILKLQSEQNQQDAGLTE